MDTSAAAPSCSSCGAQLPAAARFCPSCGESTEDEAATVRAPVPFEEPEPGPPTLAQSQPRWFGLTPPLLSLVLAVGAVGAAVALFATDSWPEGVILLGVAALFLALYVEVALRKPKAAPVPLPTDALAQVRNRAGAAVEEIAVRSRAAGELLRLRHQRAALHETRRMLLADLGEAVYGEDGVRVDQVRADLDAVDDQLRALETAMREVVETAQERVENARLAVQDTQMVEIPEPYPPPDEGTPPGPAIVPEPSPPPDELTPPPPDPVPTPLSPEQDD
jgi:hypothetical protein